MTGHDAPERAVTIARSTHPRPRLPCL